MSTPSSALRKAAILVASLDQRSADALLDRMSAEQQALVRRMMAELGDALDRREQQDVLVEFFQVDSGGWVRTTGESTSRGPIAAGRRAPSLADLDDLASVDQPPFRFLREATGEKLTPLLEGEHPQTIAVVVSHLPPDRASAVLSALGAGLQADVLRRLVELDEADPATLREVEQGLKSRIVEQVRDERRRAAGLQAVNSILAASDPRVRRQILANLTRHDRRLAGKLAPPQLEFGDLAMLDDANLEFVLQSADASVVRLALAGAPPLLCDRVMRLLPTAEARLLRQDLESLGPTRLSDMEQAQAELAALARGLAAEGRIDAPVRARALTG